MTDSIHRRAKQLFVAALEKAEDEREAFIERAASGSPGLAAEVLSLLEHHAPEDVSPEDRTPVQQTDEPINVPELQPGELFADRYRILSRIGTGGSGDVYRATDETLSVTVALKRLRREDAVSAEAVLNEVRLGRTVTHPVITRLYDVGLWDGQPYLTMEFVAGEDLATLTRRSGRLPSERVAEIGRTLCVGLAAAHAQGVLHRDLKPANVLIEDDGRVRITDFGISSPLGEITDRVAGTPSYMSPEQFLPGTVVDARTDLFSLGAVLYELLTGRRAFAAGDLTSVLASHRSGAPTPPSKWVDDVDPALERVIMSALAFDPSERPESALAFAAELPGGDPLGAALEAGVTPSPQVVARGRSDANRLTVARTGPWLAGLTVLLAATAGISDFGSTFPAFAGDVRPSVRASEAAALLSELGWTDPGSEGQYGFMLDPSKVRPTALFWTKFDVAPLRTSFDEAVLDPARDLMVYVAAPAAQLGRAETVFDAEGRLVYLRVRGAASEGAAAPTNWAPLLARAGAEGAIASASTDWTPPDFADERVTWTLSGTSEPGRRFDGAAVRGRPVYFAAHPVAATSEHLDARIDRAGLLGLISFPLVTIVIIAAAVLAFRNLRAGRVDTVGARRIVGFVVVLLLVRAAILGGTYTHPSATGAEMLWQRLLVIFPMVVPAVVFYLGFEPHVRRHWPDTLVAWTAAVLGHFRNPAVGRALLLGTVAGAGLGVIAALDGALVGAFASGPVGGFDQAPRFLASLGVTESLALLLRELVDAAGRGGLALFIFVYLQSALRNRALTLAPFLVVFAALEVLAAGVGGLSWITLGVPYALVYALLILRTGLLTLVVAMWTSYSLRFAPLTLNPDAWWVTSSYTVLAAVAAVGLVGAWLARGGALQDPGHPVRHRVAA